jgi:phage virion morphogenesis protein
MSGISIDISTDQDEIEQRLQKIAARSADLSDALAEIGEEMVPSTKARFVRAVAPDGSPWAPLAPNTLAMKKGPGILREALHLQESFRYQVSGGALEVGTNVPYAAAHHFGRKPHVIRPKTGKALFWSGARHPVRAINHPGLAARPMLGVSTEDEGAILAILSDYLTK